MIYLKSVYRRSDQDLPEKYPFNVGSIKSTHKIIFEESITFFTGENGTGKSTMLATIAAGMEAYAVGFSGHISSDLYLNHANNLSKFYYFSRIKKPNIKMYMRAEDALGYIRATNEERLRETQFKRHEELSEINEKIEYTSIINSNELNNKSHGEYFLEILDKKTRGTGIYFLDEPESPLSVYNQIKLASFIKEKSENGAQFIISTHSPILLGMPGSTIYEFTDHEISEKKFDNLRSVALLRRYLEDPKKYLSI